MDLDGIHLVSSDDTVVLGLLLWSDLNDTAHWSLSLDLNDSLGWDGLSADWHLSLGLDDAADWSLSLDLSLTFAEDWWEVFVVESWWQVLILNCWCILDDDDLIGNNWSFLYNNFIKDWCLWLVTWDEAIFVIGTVDAAERS